MGDSMSDALKDGIQDSSCTICISEGWVVSRSSSSDHCKWCHVIDPASIDTIDQNSVFLCIMFSA